MNIHDTLLRSDKFGSLVYLAGLFFFAIFLLPSCVRPLILAHGVRVPPGGFPGYEQRTHINDEKYLRFDGLYCRRFAIESKKPAGASVVDYYRFWSDGSVLQGGIPNSWKTPIDKHAELPTAQDGDQFNGVVVGKYKYDPDSHLLVMEIYTCPPVGWRFIETKYKCTDDGRLIVVQSSAEGGWGGQDPGDEWKFIELPGMKEKPFW